MNWDDARVFLAVCRESTLRGAARVLGVDQATVGRRVTALEKSLSATLFLRTSEGYALTAVGEAALQAVEKMEVSALDLQRQIQGLDDRLTGTVRVSTTDSLAIDFLIPAIARLHDKHPDVQVQLDASTQMISLAKREADIAVRNARPDNPDLIARRIARWPVGLFASQGYVDAHGVPEPGSAFEGHDLVVYQPYLAGNKEMTLVSEPLTRGRIVSSLGSGLLVRRSIAAGIGVGEIPVYMGERDGLVRLWPERTRPVPYDVWLVTHADLRHTARVRAVIDEIVAGFSGTGE
ncbi:MULTISPECIES: LysR family transcriptional regulator [Pseudomonas]|jgi:DNA-binding transcriptional LysR family regulator|uniref:LysR family transcriptional regulator n=1 Tax=Pseudomonas TaxID=286 RepID=UPI0006B5582D|nr:MULTISPECIES: LysR family transcriptional regulator [Pseudomonas]KOY01751.1 LysR family transcriptional regulator [Pseudomonas nunensis]MDN3222084.1 LysR family transcriptional regulator [Pseudomonas nunensis]UZE14158.1 LysR family transcriptional regulator [Pseudomonas sp. B21-053]